jgi:hypothetical protein
MLKVTWPESNEIVLRWYVLTLSSEKGHHRVFMSSSATDFGIPGSDEFTMKAVRKSAKYIRQAPCQCDPWDIRLVCTFVT